MLEKPFVAMLTSFLSTYVDDLNSKQLQVNLWSGRVTLEHVRLKHDALLQLGLPLSVEHSVIRRLEVVVPWSNIQTKSPVVTINGVDIICSPAASHSARGDAETKADVLQRFEASREMAEKEARGSSSTFVARLRDSWLKNMVLNISNINISVVLPLRSSQRRSAGSSSASGHHHRHLVTVSIASLVLQHMDGNWTAVPDRQPREGISRRMFSFTGFAVQLVHQVDEQTVDAAGAANILQPVSFECKMQFHEPSSLPSTNDRRSQPLAEALRAADIHCPSLGLSLSHDHMCLLLTAVAFWEQSKQLAAIVAQRPRVPCRGKANCVAWLRYIVLSVRRVQYFEHKKQQIERGRTMLERDYLAMHKAKATSAASAAGGAGRSAPLPLRGLSEEYYKVIEAVLPVTRLLELRRRAYAETQQSSTGTSDDDDQDDESISPGSTAPADKSAAANSGWFGWMWRSKKATAPDSASVAKGSPLDVVLSKAAPERRVKFSTGSASIILVQVDGEVARLSVHEATAELDQSPTIVKGSIRLSRLSVTDPSASSADRSGILSTPQHEDFVAIEGLRRVGTQGIVRGKVSAVRVVVRDDFASRMLRYLSLPAAVWTVTLNERIGMREAPRMKSPQPAADSTLSPDSEQSSTARSSTQPKQLSWVAEMDYDLQIASPTIMLPLPGGGRRGIVIRLGAASLRKSKGEVVCIVKGAAVFLGDATQRVSVGVNEDLWLVQETSLELRSTLSSLPVYEASATFSPIVVDISLPARDAIGQLLAVANSLQNESRLLSDRQAFLGVEFAGPFNVGFSSNHSSLLVEYSPCTVSCTTGGRELPALLEIEYSSAGGPDAKPSTFALELRNLSAMLYNKSLRRLSPESPVARAIASIVEDPQVSAFVVPQDGLPVASSSMFVLVLIKSTTIDNAKRFGRCVSNSMSAYATTVCSPASSAAASRSSISFSADSLPQNTLTRLSRQQSRSDRSAPTFVFKLGVSLPAIVYAMRSKGSHAEDVHETKALSTSVSLTYSGGVNSFAGKVCVGQLVSKWNGAAVLSTTTQSPLDVSFEQDGPARTRSYHIVTPIISLTHDYDTVKRMISVHKKFAAPLLAVEESPTARAVSPKNMITENHRGSPKSSEAVTRSAASLSSSRTVPPKASLWYTSLSATALGLAVNLVDKGESVLEVALLATTMKCAIDPQNRRRSATLRTSGLVIRNDMTNEVLVGAGSPDSCRSSDFSNVISEDTDSATSSSPLVITLVEDGLIRKVNVHVDEYFAIMDLELVKALHHFLDPKNFGWQSQSHSRAHSRELSMTAVGDDMTGGYCRAHVASSLAELRKWRRTTRATRVLVQEVLQYEASDQQDGNERADPVVIEACVEMTQMLLGVRWGGGNATVALGKATALGRASYPGGVDDASFTLESSSMDVGAARVIDRLALGVKQTSQDGGAIVRSLHVGGTLVKVTQQTVVAMFHCCAAAREVYLLLLPWLPEPQPTVAAAPLPSNLAASFADPSSRTLARVQTIVLREQTPRNRTSSTAANDVRSAAGRLQRTREVLSVDSISLTIGEPGHLLLVAQLDELRAAREMTMTGDEEKKSSSTTVTALTCCLKAPGQDEELVLLIDTRPSAAVEALLDIQSIGAEVRATVVLPAATPPLVIPIPLANDVAGWLSPLRDAVQLLSAKDATDSADRSEQSDDDDVSEVISHGSGSSLPPSISATPSPHAVHDLSTDFPMGRTFSQRGATQVKSEQRSAVQCDVHIVGLMPICLQFARGCAFQASLSGSRSTVDIAVGPQYQHLGFVGLEIVVAEKQLVQRCTVTLHNDVVRQLVTFQVESTELTVVHEHLRAASTAMYVVALVSHLPLVNSRGCCIVEDLTLVERSDAAVDMPPCVALVGPSAVTIARLDDESGQYCAISIPRKRGIFSAYLAEGDQAVEFSCDDAVVVVVKGAGAKRLVHAVRAIHAADDFATSSPDGKDFLGSATHSLTITSLTASLLGQHVLSLNKAVVSFGKDRSSASCQECSITTGGTGLVLATRLEAHWTVRKDADNSVSVVLGPAARQRPVTPTSSVEPAAVDAASPSISVALTPTAFFKIMNTVDSLDAHVPQVLVIPLPQRETASTIKRSRSRTVSFSGALPWLSLKVTGSNERQQVLRAVVNDVAVITPSPGVSCLKVNSVALVGDRQQKLVVVRDVEVEHRSCDDDAQSPRPDVFMSTTPRGSSAVLFSSSPGDVEAEGRERERGGGSAKNSWLGAGGRQGESPPLASFVVTCSVGAVGVDITDPTEYAWLAVYANRPTTPASTRPPLGAFVFTDAPPAAPDSVWEVGASLRQLDALIGVIGVSIVEAKGKISNVGHVGLCVDTMTVELRHHDDLVSKTTADNLSPRRESVVSISRLRLSKGPTKGNALHPHQHQQSASSHRVSHERMPSQDDLRRHGSFRSTAGFVTDVLVSRFTVECSPIQDMTTLSNAWRRLRQATSSSAATSPSTPPPTTWSNRSNHSSGLFSHSKGAPIHSVHWTVLNGTLVVHLIDDFTLDGRVVTFEGSTAISSEPSATKMSGLEVIRLELSVTHADVPVVEYSAANVLRVTTRSSSAGAIGRSSISTEPIYVIECGELGSVTIRFTEKLVQVVRRHRNDLVARASAAVSQFNTPGASSDEDKLEGSFTRYSLPILQEGERVPTSDFTPPRIVGQVRGPQVSIYVLEDMLLSLNAVAEIDSSEGTLNSITGHARVSINCQPIAKLSKIVSKKSQWHSATSVTPFAWSDVDIRLQKRRLSMTVEPFAVDTATHLPASVRTLLKSKLSDQTLSLLASRQSPQQIYVSRAELEVLFDIVSPQQTHVNEIRLHVDNLVAKVCTTQRGIANLPPTELHIDLRQVHLSGGDERGLAVHLESCDVAAVVTQLDFPRITYTSSDAAPVKKPPKTQQEISRDIDRFLETVAAVFKSPTGRGSDDDSEEEAQQVDRFGTGHCIDLSEVYRTCFIDKNFNVDVGRVQLMLDTSVLGSSATSSKQCRHSSHLHWSVHVLLGGARSLGRQLSILSLNVAATPVTMRTILAPQTPRDGADDGAGGTAPVDSKLHDWGRLLLDERRGCETHSFFRIDNAQWNLMTSSGRAAHCVMEVDGALVHDALLAVSWIRCRRVGLLSDMREVGGKSKAEQRWRYATRSVLRALRLRTGYTKGTRMLEGLIEQQVDAASSRKKEPISRYLVGFIAFTSGRVLAEALAAVREKRASSEGPSHKRHSIYCQLRPAGYSPQKFKLGRGEDSSTFLDDASATPYKLFAGTIDAVMMNNSQQLLRILVKGTSLSIDHNRIESSVENAHVTDIVDGPRAAPRTILRLSSPQDSGELPRSASLSRSRSLRRTELETGVVPLASVASFSSTLDDYATVGGAGSLDFDPDANSKDDIACKLIFSRASGAVEMFLADMFVAMRAATVKEVISSVQLPLEFSALGIQPLGRVRQAAEADRLARLSVMMSPSCDVHIDRLSLLMPEHYHAASTPAIGLTFTAFRYFVPTSHDVQYPPVMEYSTTAVTAEGMELHLVHIDREQDCRHFRSQGHLWLHAPNPLEFSISSTRDRSHPRTWQIVRLEADNVMLRTTPLQFGHAIRGFGAVMRHWAYDVYWQNEAVIFRDASVIVSGPRFVTAAEGGTMPSWPLEASATLALPVNKHWGWYRCLRVDPRGLPGEEPAPFYLHLNPLSGIVANIAEHDILCSHNPHPDRPWSFAYIVPQDGLPFSSSRAFYCTLFWCSSQLALTTVTRCIDEALAHERARPTIYRNEYSPSICWSDQRYAVKALKVVLRKDSSLDGETLPPLDLDHVHAHDDEDTDEGSAERFTIQLADFAYTQVNHQHDWLIKVFSSAATCEYYSARAEEADAVIELSAVPAREDIPLVEHQMILTEKSPKAAEGGRKGAATQLTMSEIHVKLQNQWQRLASFLSSIGTGMGDGYSWMWQATFLEAGGPQTPLDQRWFSRLNASIKHIIIDCAHPRKNFSVLHADLSELECSKLEVAFARSAVSASLRSVVVHASRAIAFRGGIRADDLDRTSKPTAETCPPWLLVRYEANSDFSEWKRAELNVMLQVMVKVQSSFITVPVATVVADIREFFAPPRDVQQRVGSGLFDRPARFAAAFEAQRTAASAATTRAKALAKYPHGQLFDIHSEQFSCLVPAATASESGFCLSSEGLVFLQQPTARAAPADGTATSRSRLSRRSGTVVKAKSTPLVSNVDALCQLEVYGTLRQVQVKVILPAGVNQSPLAPKPQATEASWETVPCLVEPFTFLVNGHKTKSGNDRKWKLTAHCSMIRCGLTHGVYAFMKEVVDKHMPPPSQHDPLEGTKVVASPPQSPKKPRGCSQESTASPGSNAHTIGPSSNHEPFASSRPHGPDPADGPAPASTWEVLPKSYDVLATFDGLVLTASQPSGLLLAEASLGLVEVRWTQAPSKAYTLLLMLRSEIAVRGNVVAASEESTEVPSAAKSSAPNVPVLRIAHTSAKAEDQLPLVQITQEPQAHACTVVAIPSIRMNLHAPFLRAVTEFALQTNSAESTKARARWRSASTRVKLLNVLSAKASSKAANRRQRGDRVVKRSLALTGDLELSPTSRWIVRGGGSLIEIDGKNFSLVLSHREGQELSEDVTPDRTRWNIVVDKGTTLCFKNVTIMYRGMFNDHFYLSKDAKVDIRQANNASVKCVEDDVDADDSDNDELRDIHLENLDDGGADSGALGIDDEETIRAELSGSDDTTSEVSAGPAFTRLWEVKVAVSDLQLWIPHLEWADSRRVLAFQLAELGLHVVANEGVMYGSSTIRGLALHCATYADLLLQPQLPHSDAILFLGTLSATGRTASRLRSAVSPAGDQISPKQRVHCTLDLDGVAISGCVQDATTVVTISMQQLKALRSITQSTARTMEKQALQQKHQDRKNRHGNAMDTSVTSDCDDAASTQQKAAKYNAKFIVKISDVNAVLHKLLSNGEESPFVRFSLSELSAEGRVISPAMVHTGGIDVVCGVDMYNHDACGWEPVLERCGVLIRSSAIKNGFSSAAASGKISNTISIIAGNTVNLNVSRFHLESASRAIDDLHIAWSQGLEEDVSAKRRRWRESSSHAIKNDTGTAFSLCDGKMIVVGEHDDGNNFSSPWGDRTGDDDSEVSTAVRVASGSTIVVKLLEQQYAVAFDGIPIHIPVALFSPGQHFLSYTSRQYIVLDVKLSPVGLLCQFRSGLVFVNQCLLEMRVTMNGWDSLLPCNIGLEHATIDNSVPAPLPAVVAKKPLCTISLLRGAEIIGTASFEPLKTSALDVVEALDDAGDSVTPFQHASVVPIRFASADPREAKHLIVHVAAKTVSHTPGAIGERIVTIAPPITIQNLLPCGVFVVVAEDRAGLRVLSREALAPNEVLTVYHDALATQRDQIFVGCRIDSFQGRFLRPSQLSPLVKPLTKMKLFDVFTKERLNVLLEQDAAGDTATAKFIIKVEAVIVTHLPPHLCVLSNDRPIVGTVSQAVVESNHCFFALTKYESLYLPTDHCIGCGGWLATDDSVEQCQVCLCLAHEQCSVTVRHKRCCEGFQNELQQPIRTMLFTPPPHARFRGKMRIGALSPTAVTNESPEFPYDTVNMQGCVTCQLPPNAHESGIVHTETVGIMIAVAPGQFLRSKLIALAPFIVLENKSDRCIAVFAAAGGGLPLVRLAPSEEQNLRFSFLGGSSDGDETRAKLIKDNVIPKIIVRVVDKTTGFYLFESPPFDPCATGNACVRLFPLDDGEWLLVDATEDGVDESTTGPNEAPNSARPGRGGTRSKPPAEVKEHKAAEFPVLSVQSSRAGASLRVTLSNATLPPVRIVNHTWRTAHYLQHAKKSSVMFHLAKVGPFETAPYYFEDHAASPLVIEIRTADGTVFRVTPSEAIAGDGELDGIDLVDKGSGRTFVRAVLGFDASIIVIEEREVLHQLSLSNILFFPRPQSAAALPGGEKPSDVGKDMRLAVAYSRQSRRFKGARKEAEAHGPVSFLPPQDLILLDVHSPLEKVRFVIETGTLLSYEPFAHCTFPIGAQGKNFGSLVIPVFGVNAVDRSTPPLGELLFEWCYNTTYVEDENEPIASDGPGVMTTPKPARATIAPHYLAFQPPPAPLLNVSAEFSVCVSFIGMDEVTRRQREEALIHVSSVYCSLQQQPTKEFDAELIIGRWQVDNQNPDAIFPVALSTPPDIKVLSEGGPGGSTASSAAWQAVTDLDEASSSVGSPLPSLVASPSGNLSHRSRHHSATLSITSKKKAKFGKNSVSEFVHVSIANLLHKSPVITMCSYAGVCVQEIIATLDDHFLGKTFAVFPDLLLRASVLDFKAAATSLTGIVDRRALGEASGLEPANALRAADPISAAPRSSDRMLFFKYLQLHPLLLNLTFVSSSEVAASSNPMMVMLRTVGVVDVEGAPVHINALLATNVFGPSDDIIRVVREHFTTQVLRSIYKLLGALTFLGNPVNLLTNLGDGIVDLFYEPAKGLVKSPKHFAKGLAKGIGLFAAKTVAGTVSSIGSVLSGVSNGIAKLSMDEGWARHRRRQLRKRPRHVGEGLSRAAQHAGRGIIEGVTGIFTQPYRGAVREGGIGFLKGLGRGLAGIVVKPVTGVLDGLSAAAATAKQGLSDEYLRFRSRPPRAFLHSTNLLTPYDFDASLAFERLVICDDSAFKGDTFVGHSPSVNLDEEYILSTSRIVCIQRRMLNSHWSVVLSDIQQVSDERSGTELVHLVVHLKPQSLRIGRSQHVLYLGLPDRCRAFLLMLQSVYPRLNTTLKHVSLKEGSAVLTGSFAAGGEPTSLFIKKSKIQQVIDDEERLQMGVALRLNEQQQFAQCCDCDCDCSSAQSAQQGDALEDAREGPPGQREQQREWGGIDMPSTPDRSLFTSPE